jgi:hypothetical protein
MGRPENIEGFTGFKVEDITFYVENRVLNEYAKDNRVIFYLDEYGKFVLEIPDE